MHGSDVERNRGGGGGGGGVKRSNEMRVGKEKGKEVELVTMSLQIN